MHFKILRFPNWIDWQYWFYTYCMPREPVTRYFFFILLLFIDWLIDLFIYLFFNFIYLLIYLFWFCDFCIRIMYLVVNLFWLRQTMFVLYLSKITHCNTSLHICFTYICRPVPVTTVLLIIVQRLLAKYLFLQDNGNILAIENR